jgi:uncharacterized delta-60 repeat protein
MLLKALRWVSVVAVVPVLCGLFASLATAAPADLDRTFGQRGFAGISPALAVPQGNERVIDMAIGPQDEILVLSEACPQSLECQLAVTRYSQDGFRDFAYGSGGRSVISVRQSSVEGPAAARASIAADANGNVVVATSNEGNLALFRFDSRGAPDPGFGQAGRVIVDLGENEAATEVAVQADGNIVVAGRLTRGAPAGGDADLILARYLPNGSADPGFGQGGSIVTNLLPDDLPVALAIAGDGRIVVGVDECCSGRGRAVVARFLQNGALDGGFSSQVGLGAASLNAFVPLANGKLYVIGDKPATGRRGSSSFIARLLENGRPDRKFGREGSISLGSSAGSVNQAAVDDSGRLVLGGNVNGGRGTSLWVMRRLRNGRPDRTFAGGWQQRFALGGTTQVDALAVQESGRIVLLGEGAECFRSCSAWHPVLMRFRGGDSAVRCMGRKATIVGTRRADALNGTGHRDVIAALAGNDHVKGRGGNDLICGGAGHDRIDGGPGRNRIAQ